MRHTTKAVANKPTKMRPMVKTGDSYSTDDGTFVAEVKPTPMPASPADLSSEPAGSHVSRDTRTTVVTGSGPKTTPFPPKEVPTVQTKPGGNRAVVKFKDQILAEGGEVLNRQKGAVNSGSVSAKSTDHASFANSQIPPDVPVSADDEDM